MKSFAIGTDPLQRVEVRVAGYELPDAANPYDDLLTVEVSVASGAFSGSFPADILASELSAFAKQARSLYTYLKGEIRLKTISSHLEMSLSADATGHIHVRGEAREDPAIWARLLFEFSFDQTYFLPMVQSAEAAAQAFPPRT